MGDSKDGRHAVASMGRVGHADWSLSGDTPSSRDTRGSGLHFASYLYPLDLRIRF